jgi:hypothetical protein
MPQTLTDTQLVLLSAASQRDDGLLVQPPHLRGGVAKAVADRMLGTDLIAEVYVDVGAPHWREDEDGRRIGLRITPTGLQAIGVTEEVDCEPAEPPAPSAAGDSRSACLDSPAAQPPSVREGSKQAVLVMLLNRELGATVDQLRAATGWLPHTTRAALTGLRKRGFVIQRHKDGGGPTVYRIEQRPPLANAAPTDLAGAA